MPNESELIAALKTVNDPELDKSIVELGMVKDLVLDDTGKVSFTLALTTLACPLRNRMADQAKEALTRVAGVQSVEVVFGVLNRDEIKAISRREDVHLPEIKQFNQIKRVFLVMSGKGGVGKSSVAAMLAVNMANLGARVGILDADITGPSIPKLFGLPPGGLRGGDLGMLPAITQKGVRVVSTNLLLKEADTPTVWRGPLISATIRQFWGDTIWGRLDALIVDLPPGTSDAAIAALNYLPVNGAVVVTTPQELAGLVVRKAIKLLQSREIPVLALIENMSHYLTPSGESVELFGPSHLANLADLTSGARTIRLPILPEISQQADAGNIEALALPELQALSRDLLG
jgi:Mrp family chromosome partitioning ATPase